MSLAKAQTVWTIASGLNPALYSILVDSYGTMIDEIIDIHRDSHLVLPPFLFGFFCLIFSPNGTTGH